MADRYEKPTESDESATPADPRGEDLASDRLPDADGDYEIAPDETQAEELTDAGDDDQADPVDDHAQLEEAEAEAVETPTTRPRKRKDLRAAAAAAPLADPDEPAELAEPAPSTRPVRSSVVAKKDHATARRDHAVVEKSAPKRTTPAQFVREVVAELRKVVWPTGQQLGQYFTVVLVFVLFIILLVSVLDYAFGWTLLKLLG